MSTCVLVVLVLAWGLGGHHLAARSRHLTEGSAACALGLATGVVLLAAYHLLARREFIVSLLEFNATSFFNYLLPPVILYAGLSVEKSRFFLALPSILMFGVFGTLLSFLVIAGFMYGALGFALFQLEDCLAMGAIFAATDSVATLQVLDRHAMPSLFALVFGEGVVNDAVSVVLLGAVANAAKARGAASHSAHSVAGGVVLNFVWLLVTSLLLGGAVGLAVAVVLRRMKLRDAHQELAIIALLSYMSYLLADALGLSAILSLFVCGVVVSHYALHNVSPEGAAATMSAVRSASWVAEGIIFLYVGMDALDPLKWRSANALEATWLVLLLTLLLPVARAAFVAPLCLLHNWWAQPQDRLSARDAVVIWWAGLMRGAVSVALTYLFFDDDSRQMLDRTRATLIVSTLLVVVLSILGFGAFTKPLLAAMIKDDAEAAQVMAQLRSIPLLGNLTNMHSGSFQRLPRNGSDCSSATTPMHSRHGSSGSNLVGGSNGGSGHSHGAAAATARTWGAPDAGLQPGSSSSQWLSAGGGLQPPGAPGGAGTPQPWADLGAPPGAGHAPPDTYLHRQSAGAQPGGAAAVELQAQQLSVQSESAAAGGGMVTAMQQVGQAWGAFDRAVMQPVFGGPGAHAWAAQAQAQAQAQASPPPPPPPQPGASLL